MPAVSVIIPAYGHANLIEETLESVFQQTFTDYEVIVVNDGSPDHTAEVLRPYRETGKIIYLEQPNGGQASARNRGIQAAQGEFIALLDDDDRWPPNKLAWQVEELRRAPEICLVAGDARNDWETTLRDQGGALGSPRWITFESLFAGNPVISPGQTLIRRETIERAGGFRPDVWGSDDWELYLRLSRLGKVARYPRAALFYRQHGGNASRHMCRLLRNTLKVLHIHLASMPPSFWQRTRRKTYEWVYAFAVKNAVLQIKQSFRRREAPAFFAALTELTRRLTIVHWDRTILRCLFRDLVRGDLG